MILQMPGEADQLDLDNNGTDETTVTVVIEFEFLKKET